MKHLAVLFLVSVFIFSCGKKKHNYDKKGFQVSEIESEDEVDKGINQDSLKFETRPRNVLKTAHKNHRLTPIYMINYHKKTKKPFIGSNAFHYSYQKQTELEYNNWNNNIMPGFEAMYGYNLVNVSHFNTETKINNVLFENPVLIKTVYYPSFTRDTLNANPILRNNYLVTVYDEDTNKDGFINVKDLRRMYSFNLDGLEKNSLVPQNYSVMSSEYDSSNDFMYVFARNDENNNGKMENEETMNVFWIDLKNISNHGLLY